MSTRFKNYDFHFTPNELYIDLKAANWLVGSYGMVHLNTLLSHSETAYPKSIHDLKRMFKGYPLGLLVDGRPLWIAEVDPIAYLYQGIEVNTPSLRAIRFQARTEDGVLMNPLKSIMLFVALGKSRWPSS
jgi:hypothetical protein